ncbi:MAG: ring-opening amidohydrolase [Candidatus Obscuribacterales bacterium]|nr:ring-opening amidohydrolase [Candidatus Obscuribacterales bacterium]
MKISAQKFLTSGPADVVALEKSIDDGEIVAGDVLCVIGKTEGNGGSNDFTRELASYALEDLFSKKLKISKAEVRNRIIFSLSGGCEGVVTPHILVFSRSGEISKQKFPKKRLVIGSGFTRGFRPSEIGRQAQITETAFVIKQILDEMQIESVDDVHLIQMKGAVPDFSPEDAKFARKNGQSLRCDMSYSRAASALGAAIALDEVRPIELDDETVCQDWSIYSSVASASAKLGLKRTEILVFGNSNYWQGDLEINHGVLKDMLDTESVSDTLAGLGIVADNPEDPILNRIVGVFAKSEADLRGSIRGRRHTMLNDDDISDTRYSRCVLGAVIASVVNDTSIYISTRAEHHGPCGGGTLAIIARQSMQ